MLASTKALLAASIVAVSFVCRVALSPAAEVKPPYFKIKVVDEQTGRGVPLVELRTTPAARYFTDSNGIVAFHEPGLMGQKVFFTVQSHGYEFPKDGFGFAGTALDVREGGAAELKIKRLNIAERLYRVTGAGIYRDTIVVGEKPPTRQPSLNAQVTGQDSVMAAPWRGKLYWLWGDTNRLRYPLGLFRTSGATSRRPGRGGLAPEVGVDLEYFADKEGFSRAMCPFGGEGLIWIEGLLTVAADDGQERMATRYMRMKSLGEMLEHGLAVFDADEGAFKKAAEFDVKQQWRCPRGHPIRFKDGGTDFLLFNSPFAIVRVKAQLKEVKNQASYEAFTCLAPGSRYEKAAADVERGPKGELVYGWKPNTDPLNAAQERELIAAGKIKEEEAWFQPKDVDGGKPVLMHSGSIHWNEFRKTWIMIAVQSFGSPSLLGELWFSEADAPTGPWRWAKKIVTHDKYSFYNPAHHDFFDQHGGKTIFFEGTYTSSFSGNPDQTPWYDYNQIMYRLDLSDPRLPRPLAPAQNKP